MIEKKTEDQALNENGSAGKKPIDQTLDDQHLAAPQRKTIHLGLDVRGALTNWRLGQFRGMFKKEDGTYMEPREAKAALLEELAQGREVLPYGAPCEGWDYKEGCPGHPEAAPDLQGSGPASSMSTGRARSTPEKERL